MKEAVMNKACAGVKCIAKRAVLSKATYRLFIAATIVLSLSGQGLAAELQTIKLNEPNKKRGLPLMEALAIKASAREWSDRELTLQDLSDLVWAANGLNRPDENKSTASSAQNAHDVDLYLFMKDGVYLYDAGKHELIPVLSGDFRSQIMMARPLRPAGGPESGATPPPPPPSSNPPIQIILISDIARFKMGPPELKYEWGAIAAGIVSQNISLFCAATGIKTRPRASMDKEKMALRGIEWVV